MNLSQIRNRIEALERRFALPLTAVRLRPHATPVLRPVGHRPRPQATPARNLPTSSASSPTPDSASPTYTNLSLFLERHRENNTCPMPSQIVSTLLPGQKARKIIDALFRFDPPAEEPPHARPCSASPHPPIDASPTRRYHSPQRPTRPQPPIRKEPPHGRANNGRWRHPHRGPQQPRR